MDTSSGHVSPDLLGNVPADVILGKCPICLCAVVYADSALPGNNRAVLLDSVARVPVALDFGMTAVVVSAVGRHQVVEPWIYRLHSCPPGAITNSIGYYVPSVLSQTCPVILCHAQPGELCISTRHEVLLCPHGSRVAFAAMQTLDKSEE